MNLKRGGEPRNKTTPFICSRFALQVLPHQVPSAQNWGNKLWDLGMHVDKQCTQSHQWGGGTLPASEGIPIWWMANKKHRMRDIDLLPVLFNWPILLHSSLGVRSWGLLNHGGSRVSRLHGNVGGEPILPERGCDIILMCCAVILVAVLLIHAYSKGAPPQYRIDIICLLMKEYLASWLFEDPLWTCLELCIQNGMGDNKYVQNRYICAMQGQVGFFPRKGLIS